MKQKHFLFVYGTLKRGFWNHHFLEGEDFLGPAETLEKFAMYENGIPFVTEDEQVSTIKGELYLISDEALERIDRLEGHPFAYQRKKTRVVTEDGSQVEAWIYFHPRPRGARLVRDGIFQGNFRELSSKANRRLKKSP